MSAFARFSANSFLGIILLVPKIQFNSYQNVIFGILWISWPHVFLQQAAKNKAPKDTI